MSTVEDSLLSNTVERDEIRSKGFTSKTFWKYVWKFTLYYLIVLLFVVNFTSASIALQINREKNIFSKILSFVFALCFGIVYIFINYYYYRIKVKGDATAYFCSEDIFPF